jgi:hypothetical protein
MVKITERHDYRRVIEALGPQPLTASIDIHAAIQGLARKGANLRQRYENECSYERYCSPEYQAGTRKLELLTRQLAERAGLEIYLQGDCRGATVYVSREPIAANGYNRHGSHCLYFKGIES